MVLLIFLLKFCLLLILSKQQLDIFFLFRQSQKMRKKNGPLFSVDNNPMEILSPSNQVQKSKGLGSIQSPKNSNLPSDSYRNPISNEPTFADSLDQLNYEQNRESNNSQKSEMNRLITTIKTIANKQKSYLPNKQTSTFAYPTQSELSSNSEMKLPSLNRIYPKENEQSKLIEEIRRVENRIKDLKFQRSDTQPNNLEMMRPFLQIQNQNMINLQMMILGQQRCNHQNSCCRENHNRSIQHPGHYSKYRYGTNQSFNTEEDQYGTIQKRGIKRRGKNNPSKKYNVSKIRKFRIVVIAVYFALLFPKFANKFTIKRFKIHSQKYFSNKQQPQKTVQIFIDEMLSLNSVKIAQQVREARKDNKSGKVGKTAKLIITEQYEGKKNFQFYIGDVEMFLLEFLKKMHHLITQTKLEAVLRQIVDGNLPSSFPIDDYHLLDQMYRVTYHPLRLYLRMSKEQSKAFILSHLFVKFLIFDFMFIIKDHLEMKKKLLKLNKYHNDQMIEVELAATEMYFSGILLHRYCMDLIKERLQNVEGNIPSVDPKNLPIPQTTLVFNHYGQIEKALGVTKKAKINKRESVNSNSSDQSGLGVDQYEDEQLFQFSYVKNLENFEALIKLIKKTSNFEVEIKDKINDIIDLVYQRMIFYRNKDYEVIKEEVLLEKRILKHKIDYSELKMPKRNNEVRDFLKEVAKTIRQNKRNQIKSIEQQGEQQDDQDRRSKRSNQSSKKSGSYQFSASTL